MPVPRIALLDATDRDFLHERSLKVLAEVGVRFDSTKARAVLAEAGCEVDEATMRARIPADMVEWALGQVPADVLLAGRDPERDASLDGAMTHHTNGGICPYVVDLSSGLRRLPTLDDLGAATRVADALDAFGIVWYSMSPTADVEPRTTDLAATARMLASTSKHVMGQVQRPAEVPYVLEMLRACLGEASLRERPLFSIIYCPVAPLQHEAPALEAAMALAAEHVPIDVYSLGLAGATSPVTLAGTIIQTNCEVLSGVVLLQLVAPGCPLIYSANAGVMDMRTARFTQSNPETTLMNIAQIELAHSYGLPALSVGHASDAYELGFRGGYEGMAEAIATRLARPEILVGLGLVEAGKAISFPKLLLDAELVEYTGRIVDGFAIDDGHAHVDVIAAVAPNGHYLGRKETRRFARAGEHWTPDLFTRLAYEDLQKGAPGEVERATEAVTKILAEHKPAPLPPGAPEQVAAVLRAAEKELPDA